MAEEELEVLKKRRRFGRGGPDPVDENGNAILKDTPEKKGRTSGCLPGGGCASGCMPGCLMGGGGGLFVLFLVVALVLVAALVHFNPVADNLTVSTLTTLNLIASHSWVYSVF